MRVVATAGHVDHGKSSLVRALTGMEPDRYAEERRRGLTIDLGYAWTPLGDELLAFVDVPGHQRFIGTMLAGLGPAPAVLFVVAADEGWRRQSQEHLAAIDALGVRHGLLVVTRCDLADPAPTLADATDRLAASTLGPVPSVALSSRTGTGLNELRQSLTVLVDSLPPPDTTSPVRLWIDRAFSVRGAGTVVTSTLAAGTLHVGDRLLLDGREVTVRGLHQADEPHNRLAAVGRVAVNLRGVDVGAAGRGSVLAHPSLAGTTDLVDVRLRGPFDDALMATELSGELLLHVGTASVPVRVRPLGEHTVRLGLSRPLPLRAGDRAILRDPGPQHVVAGLEVLDVAPPSLRRRGSAARRADDLDAPADPAREISRRGLVHRDTLATSGMAGPAELHRSGGWFATDEHWRELTRQLASAVDHHTVAEPLSPGLALDVAVRSLGLPDRTLLPSLVAAAGLESAVGVLRRPGHVPSLGAGEAALVELERRLADRPFAAPEHHELALDRRQLTVAVRTGRLIELDGVYLRPDAPARAMRVLAELEQPFTTSQARQALDTTRRVVIPLLEHLDGRGWTRRLDAGHREVVR